MKTYEEPLTKKLIKSYHYHLKVGVFEDMANGYPCGEYKNRQNYVGDFKTASPAEVHNEMSSLLDAYKHMDKVDLQALAVFHCQYERIHPFQDGNGRTGRILLFKE